MKKRPKLIITLSALVCLAVAGAFALVQWWRSEWETRQIHRFHGGAIVRSFFNAGLDLYVVDHGDIPETWEKLSFLPNTMDEKFGQHTGAFWDDISSLPGAKKTPDGIENFRVWFLDKAEMAKTKGFYYQSPIVPKDAIASLAWPMAWVVYKDHGRTMVAVVSENGYLMTADEFIPFLQQAMDYAKAHGIPYDPTQIDYIKNF